MADLLRESILVLCEELKPEAVGIADALAPPDFVLNSVLGKADGKVDKKKYDYDSFSKETKKKKKI